ncbi:hypothetical protein HPB52_014316 [Rhipicephalus sanguineus]|uniref:Uncharacterized protein n=1 Tax=Rhipicephalus sanguineus TaxID=34632 RepID=A0A9D4Q063_RHISA|nr:hypothetical protein HPB52_014316 [Rhipicephalus sanguineus]
MALLKCLKCCNPNEEATPPSVLTNRVADPSSSRDTRADATSDKHPAIMDHDITSHHRGSRRIFPTTHPKLNRAQSHSTSYRNAPA